MFGLFKRKSHYKLFKNARKKWQFVLVAANNETVAAGEEYESKEGALDGIEAVRRAAKTKNVITD